MKNEKMTAEERVAHTPTPWDTLVQVKTLVHIECRAENSPDFSKHICSIPKKDIANAAFIVTACNAHEALVDALRAAEESLNEAMSLIQEDIDNRDGRDNFGISCGFCDGAIPVPHSFGCKAMTALGKGRAALSLATEVRK